MKSGKAGVILKGLRHFPQSLLKLEPAPRILVVNDIADFARVIAVLLGKGFAFNFAYNGLSAVRLAKIIVPDLIVLNQVMPDLCGLEVLRKLRADPKTRGIKIIIQSASSKSEEMSRLLGAEGFIQTPCRRMDLQGLVARVLGRPGG